jgi:1-acyl-sn-glycerol-3-phosphate acyltransferase
LKCRAGIAFASTPKHSLQKIKIMLFIKKIFWSVWKVWFYVLMLLPLLLLAPLFFVSVLKESWYPFFFQLAKFWGKFSLYGMGFYIKLEKEQEFEKGKSYMLTANHSSITDIMVMLAVSPNPFVFVGKESLAKIPYFGYFYRRSCILVDRNSPKSRGQVIVSAQEKINQGLSICIFPEGGVPKPEIFLGEFKDGAFRLAIDHGLPIVPMTFGDNKYRHPYKFFSGSPGVLRVKIHKFVETKNRTHEDRKEVREEVRAVIFKQLQEYQKNY